MNILNLIPTIVSWAGYIKAGIDAASSNAALVAWLKKNASPILDIIAYFGKQTFGDVKPDLQLAAGAQYLFDPRVNEWIQTSLNSYTKGLTTKLTVDGHYGELTRKACKIFQVEQNIDPVDGWAGQVTQARMTALDAEAAGKAASAS